MLGKFVVVAEVDARDFFGFIALESKDATSLL